MKIGKETIEKAKAIGCKSCMPTDIYYWCCGRGVQVSYLKQNNNGDERFKSIIRIGKYTSEMIDYLSGEECAIKTIEEAVDLLYLIEELKRRKTGNTEKTK